MGPEQFVRCYPIRRCLQGTYGVDTDDGRPMTRRRILFFAEVVTLAHVRRSDALTHGQSYMDTARFAKLILM